MSQLQREELLEAGRKKLKDYQLRRRSTNTSFSTSLLTDAATKRLSASSQKWRHRSLQINSKLNADDPGIPSPTTTVASPTSMHESDLQGYPSPPLSRPPSSAIEPVQPTPTASTPIPSSSSRRRQPPKPLQLQDPSNHHQQRTASSSSSRHERSQSNVIDYSAQFPSTWAYANATKSPIMPVSNMDEALTWIIQNNRLVQENQRLKRELEMVKMERAQLADTIQEMKQQHSSQSENERIKETLRQVRSQERARWAEIVEKLEREVRDLKK
ncbi:hypothetical protein O0I10_005301 [Lichtheimia ornata]|uniref:Uncharacterized protein n=1 Tax=Lichtheimia ornata TaxID=688661 RepID=A0AAD7V4U9_9FUNG|nr:uncharacterized protein O0I10_005301 [Lichtheimia ornata]KAJ8658919.1 hypothetical protein O0I10_005301 [Lichtheimia ornata]